MKAAILTTVVYSISVRIRRGALVDRQSLTMDWKTVAAARVPRLKPGATCDRRSAAKTDDFEYFPTGESGEHHPSDEPELLPALTTVLPCPFRT